MSNKNIVTGQLASITAYDPTTSQVTGVTTTGDVTTTANVNATSVLLGTGNLQLTGNVISTTSNTITIDPLNDGSPLGNVNVLGNLQVTGTLSYVSIANSVTNNFTWIAANNAVNQAGASGGGLAVGPAGAYASFTYNSLSNSWQSSLPIIANGGVNANGALSGATTGTFSGNVTAPYFIGNGSQLTDIAVAAGTEILNGTSNVTIVDPDGNITMNYAGSIAFTITTDGVAVGNATPSTVTSGTVAVGTGAAGFNVGSEVTAIGYNAVPFGSGSQAIAIGSRAAFNGQGNYSVAIGYFAGKGSIFPATSQGSNAIAIGANAGSGGQANNSIVLNATGATLNATTANTLVIAPVRNDLGNVTQSMYYNTTTKEVTYGPSMAALNGFQAPLNNATITASMAGQWIQALGTITLPVVSTVPAGTIFYITALSTVVTLAVNNNSTDFIYLPPYYNNTQRSITLYAGQWVQIISRGTGEWDIIATNVTSAQKISLPGSTGAGTSLLVDGALAFQVSISGYLEAKTQSGSITATASTLTLAFGQGATNDSFTSQTLTTSFVNLATTHTLSAIGDSATCIFSDLTNTRTYRVTAAKTSVSPFNASLTVERIS